MTLQHLILQNFRSYTKSEFSFSPKTTFIVGKNTAGKSNIVEAIHLLSTGKSFRSDRDTNMIALGKQFGRVTGASEDTTLEVVLTDTTVPGVSTWSKRYLVNNIPKRRIDFEGILPSVLFSPLDLELIIGSPSNRRNFLDNVLEQTDREYRLSTAEYTKALRQRNALLEKAQKTGSRSEKEFEYWDSILIKRGQVISSKRKELITYMNTVLKDIFVCTAYYDGSEISIERLLQYKNAEVASGVTLVGPHRDDVLFYMTQGDNKQREVKIFGSRGQQRLVVLQIKMLQIAYMEKLLGKKPLLLLDDIFSELDEAHIRLVLQMIRKQQTIITTTHEEFISAKFTKDAKIIQL